MIQTINDYIKALDQVRQHVSRINAEGREVGPEDTQIHARLLQEAEQSRRAAGLEPVPVELMTGGWL